jgi:hypothetical protein
MLTHVLLQEPTAGVVEFGDVEDEPDYTQLAHKQQHRQQQQRDGTAAAGSHNSKGNKHARSQQQQQQQQTEAPKQQLAQHKAGELTHAEPNVPEESRLQLFGKAGAAAAAGVTDDGTWQGLGLSKVLSEHMEALNFQEPTNVSPATGRCCVARPAYLNAAFILQESWCLATVLLDDSIVHPHTLPLKFD